MALRDCPFCGTAMKQHKTCFSHPYPKEGDCLLRHYSFDKPKEWNARSSEIEEALRHKAEYNSLSLGHDIRSENGDG